MKVFIRSHRDLKTLWHGDAISWTDIPYETIGNETGTIDIPDDGVDYSGEFLVLIGGNIFLIERTSPSSGTRSLTISSFYNFFSRDLIWPGMEEEETYANFIINRLNSDYKRCEDDQYKLDYLRLLVGTNTEIMPYREYEAPGIYNLVDIFDEAISYGVVFKFIFSVNISAEPSIRINTVERSLDVHNVFFDDGHSSIVSEAYSRDIISKITIFHPNTIEVPDPENEGQTIKEVEYDQTIWYLSKDGEISSDPPENREIGTWSMFEINEDEDPEEMAKLEFSNNINSHKVEFYSDRVFNLWDIVLLRIKNQVFKSYITSKSVSSTQDRYLYKCGELPTTLTDRVSKIESDKG